MEYKVLSSPLQPKDRTPPLPLTHFLRHERRHSQTLLPQGTSDLDREQRR